MFGQKHSVVGIDIGTDSIKLVELKGVVNQYQLTFAGSVPSSNIMNADTSSINQKEIDSLRVIFRDNHMLSRNAVSSFRSRPLMIQYLDFPKMNTNELSAAIRLEAGEFVTGNLDEMNMDYQVLPRAAQVVKEDKTQVLLAMAPKEIIERRIRSLRRAGLNPVTVDIDCLALVNAYLGTGPVEKKGTVVLLNIGALATNLCIVNDNNLYFARDLTFGGANFTRAIAEARGIPEPEAERIKKDPDKWAETKLNMAEMLPIAAGQLVEEIRLCLYYCRSRSPLAEVDKILITGGTSLLRGLDQFLSSQLSVPVTVWTPVRDLSNGKPGAPVKDESLAKYGPEMTVALGLAMR